MKHGALFIRRFYCIVKSLQRLPTCKITFCWAHESFSQFLKGIRGIISVHFDQLTYFHNRFLKQRGVVSLAILEYLIKISCLEALNSAHERIKFSQIQLNVRMKITTIFRRETKRPYIERIVYRNMTLVFCLVKYNIKKITKITKYLESLPRNPRTVNRGPIRINYNWFAHNFSKSFCFCQNRALSN